MLYVWGPAYRIVGRNGSNGSDADVTFANILSALQTAENTQTTFITADEFGAPTIYGAKIYGAEIYAGGVGEKGGKVIGLTSGGIQVFNGDSISVLEISAFYNNTIRDYISYIKTGGNPLSISSPDLYISNTSVHFEDATDITWGKNAPKAVFG